MDAKLKYGLMGLCGRRTSLDSKLVSWLLPNVAPESVAGREHRREEKIKLPSFGESSRKVKIYYAFANCLCENGESKCRDVVPSLFLPWVKTPFEVLSVKTFVASPLFAVTNDYYRSNKRHVSAEFQRLQQVRRKLVDASIEQRLREEPERFRILSQIAHASAASWRGVCPRQLQRRLPVRHLQRIADVGNYALADGWKDGRESAESGFAIDADPTFPHIHCEGTIPAAGQTPELWVRLRHFAVPDEPRRFGFFQGLPLINWVIDSVDAERRYLNLDARRVLDQVPCPDVTPLPDYLLREFATAEEWAATKGLSLTPDQKIDLIKQRRQAESSYQTLPTTRVTKAQLKKWNEILLEYELPREPRGLELLKFRGFHTKDSLVMTDQVQDHVNTGSRLKRPDEPSDDDHDSFSAFDGLWIDDSNQKQTQDPVDASELRRQFRIVYNPEDSPRTPEKVLEIRKHAKFQEDAHQYNVLITGAKMSDGTVRKQFERGRKRRHEIVSLHEQGHDPEFKLAHDRWWAQLPCLEVYGIPIPKFPIQGGWFVGVTLNNRPMLYRLECPWSWSAQEIPEEAETAFERLHQEKLDEAVRQAEQKTKGLSKRTSQRAVAEAKARIHAAFERVKRFYLLPTLDAVAAENAPSNQDDAA